MNGFTLFLEADDSRAENNTKRKLISFPEEKQDSDFHFREDPLLVLHILERTIQRRYDLIAICNVSGWWPCVPDATLLIVVGQSRWTGGEGEPRRLMKPRSFVAKCSMRQEKRWPPLCGQINASMSFVISGLADM